MNKYDYEEVANMMLDTGMEEMLTFSRDEEVEFEVSIKMSSGELVKKKRKV